MTGLRLVFDDSQLEPPWEGLGLCLKSTNLKTLTKQGFSGYT